MERGIVKDTPSRFLCVAVKYSKAALIRFPYNDYTMKINKKICNAHTNRKILRQLKKYYERSRIKLMDLPSILPKKKDWNLWQTLTKI